jgi:hypothetical protein
LHLLHLSRDVILDHDLHVVVAEVAIPSRETAQGIVDELGSVHLSKTILLQDPLDFSVALADLEPVGGRRRHVHKSYEPFADDVHQFGHSTAVYGVSKECALCHLETTYDASREAASSNPHILMAAPRTEGRMNPSQSGCPLTFVMNSATSAGWLANTVGVNVTMPPLRTIVSCKNCTNLRTHQAARFREGPNVVQVPPGLYRTAGIGCLIPCLSGRSTCRIGTHWTKPRCE